MHYLGVDVSMASLDLANSDGTLSRSFRNSPGGIRELIGRVLREGGIDEVQVVLEPTSTYHQRLIVALVSGGVAFTLVNPASAAYYARSRMRRSKTDPIDARMLARMGEREELTPTPLPDPRREGLRRLLRHRDSLLQEAGSWHNRLGTSEKAAWDTKVELASIRKTEKALIREASRIDKKLWQMANTHPELMRQIRLLTSIKGIATKTALVIALELPGVEQCRSAKSWAAFAGVAPAIHQSGKSEYSTLSRTGSPRIRKALYMPALVAMKFNPAIKVFIERLKANGKTGKTVVAAAMHKLLRICFGVLRTGRPFDPEMNTTAPSSKVDGAVQIQSLQTPDPKILIKSGDELTQEGKSIAEAVMIMP